MFPTQRLRRLRRTPAIRSLLQETDLPTANRMIAPLFVRPGKGVRKPIPSMLGQYQLSIDQLVLKAQQLYEKGIPAILLFGIPAHKDPKGREAYASRGIVQEAVRALKKAVPDLAVITDLCFCEYTDHGHCGILKGKSVDNDATLDIMAQTALVQAEAGADIIAPSGMMDGMVKTIRQTLDHGGFEQVLIMSYAAKYASAFYGPFRDAAESTPQFGDRCSYQMNPANAAEALREVSLDIEEGADILMVKPALAYLDIIRRIKEAYPIPVAAYNVSGEYAMVKAVAQEGWMNEAALTREILTSIRRAGADIIITYHAETWAQDHREKGNGKG